MAQPEIDLETIGAGEDCVYTATVYVRPEVTLGQYKGIAVPAAKWEVKPEQVQAEIDRAARSVIEDAGYGEYFTHRLGHQIGLEDHEPGDVSSAHHEPVRPGQTFSIEPGIYLPSGIGVRIEDLVIVTEDGCEVINSYPKQLTVLR